MFCGKFIKPFLSFDNWKFPDQFMLKVETSTWRHKGPSQCWFKILASPKILALVFFWSEMRVSFKALLRFLLFQSQRRRLRRRRLRWRLGRFNQSVLFQSMTRSPKASAFPVESVQGILWKWGVVVNFWPFNSNLHLLCGKYITHLMLNCWKCQD